MKQPGSFRDPAGFMFTKDSVLYRQINQAGQADYDLSVSSGLVADLVQAGLLVAHTEVGGAGFGKDSNRYKIIRPQLVPFVSYPYEWTFVQLKSAALTTLAVLKQAIKHGMILKDASAYNIQFIGNEPVFIDTLSFATYQAGEPWEGYKQFCEHFIAPLALAHYTSANILTLQQANIDGIALDLAVRLLPKKARWQRGLLTHLYWHNAAQKKYQPGGEALAQKPKQRKMSRLALEGLIASLERTVKKLSPPKVKTQWGDYYSFTNY
ncbi:MAG: hypothetical protein JWS12_307, partial [Candidatus Saccharibacteria bacterium]|nr:hypothetical protein [Candidatus Saccharibacteria bacterium]